MLEDKAGLERARGCRRVGLPAESNEPSEHRGCGVKDEEARL